MRGFPIDHIIEERPVGIAGVKGTDEQAPSGAQLAISLIEKPQEKPVIQIVGDGETVDEILWFRVHRLAATGEVNDVGAQQLDGTRKLKRPTPGGSRGERLWVEIDDRTVNPRFFRDDGQRVEERIGRAAADARDSQWPGAGAGGSRDFRSERFPAR